MNKITVKRGTEGPTHDPYGYVRVIFHRMTGDVIDCKIGLGCSLKVNDKLIKPIFPSGDEDNYQTTYEKEFEKYAGISFMYAVSIPDILRERRYRSMSKKDRESCIACEEADDRMMSYAV